MSAAAAHLCAALPLRILLLHALHILPLRFNLLLRLLCMCRARYALGRLVLDIVGRLRGAGGGASGFLRGRGHWDWHCVWTSLDSGWFMYVYEIQD